MTNTKRPATLSDDTLTKLAELAKRQAELAAETQALQAAIQLEQNVRLARGTKDRMKAPTPANGVAVSRTRTEDVASTPLYAQMMKLLQARPLTLRELIENTKGEENKVKVALMRMQRDEIGLMNMGNRYRALWFIPSEAFRKQWTEQR